MKETGPLRVKKRQALSRLSLKTWVWLFRRAVAVYSLVFVPSIKDRPLVHSYHSDHDSIAFQHTTDCLRDL